MDSRRALGSWISGPRAAAEEMGVEFGYRGERLGLPQEGPGSLAGVGRRLLAVCVDWWLCWLVAYGLIARGDLDGVGVWASVVFLLMSTALLLTTGFTPGKRLLGMRVVGADGSALSFVQALGRSVLLTLVVPAIVWDRDGRGLHDRALKTVEVRI